MTPEQNDLITLSKPGTPLGDLLRRYWQPVAISDELEGARPLKAVKLLGQDLVLFRDEAGQLGLVDRDCPHRGADLAFGRLEDGGLRCPFHGWLFDVNGKCLETPAEPNPAFCNRIRQKAYPVRERGGMIFAWLGPVDENGEPPALPALDCLTAPDSHVFSFKGYLDCNWLQALEVGMDPAHASFLHRYFEDAEADASYGKQFRAHSTDSDLPMTKVLREYDCPEIAVASTDSGLRITTLRHLDGGDTHVRITNVLFPQAFVIPLSSTMTITQWHVPIDDHSCYWYAMFTSFAEPVDKPLMREQRLQLYTLPDYMPRVGRHNDWGFDPAEQRMRTFTGMGEDINVHDQWAVESQGRIQDRTREHLGTTDKAIVAYRVMLIGQIKQLQKGESPLALAAGGDAATGPATIDGVAPAGTSPDSYWREAVSRLRAEASWDVPVLAL
ncbi:aromatic ring-hydroxylating dioxygenase subunit alpha [Novosphingobium flavum]|uniref:Aromatic ring-hydroxylating dioxygenase subunit alpha n=1 Tax=Novosphingobium flavum TaxID=1778672 RepID=A0A7X1KL37_9SPHN|nr:aromatic ring-hydroxylating dioxygenase subunit alpha [Novosphingobium flavum]MBC2665186.1 aromatic ring-hydroxylating dioxygenase subunit alpha [Novosphingobium flavum]